MLSNLSVLDLADGRASFCSKLLADLGARVVKIETPDNDPGRKAGPFFQSRSLSFSYNNTNKYGLVLDPKTPEGKQTFEELLTKADVLVETGNFEALTPAPGFPDRINPGLIRLSLPGHASYPTSLHGAIAVLLSLQSREITGKGCHINLSNRKTITDDDEKTGLFHILPCKDGFIQITILRNWETLLELMDAEKMAGVLTGQEWQEESCRISNIQHIAEIVAAWTRRHEKRELFHLGQSMRFPWASVEDPAEVLKSPQLRARGFFIPTELPGKGPALPFPGPPYRFNSDALPHYKPAPLPGEAGQILEDPIPLIKKRPSSIHRTRQASLKKEEILTGLRIVDLTRMLSGPYATRILADFGAEVIKIQSSATAQGAERNDAASFKIWNRNKRSLSLDLSHPEARDLFLRLVSISDIVVENYSPRVMANWGLDYSRLRQANPNLIMASISAMGQTGPWKNYVGFAPTFHALSGLLSILSHPSNSPANLQHPYADIVTALYSVLTILAAVMDRNKTGEGRHIDISAYESLCAMAGTALIASAVDVEATGADLQDLLEDFSPEQSVFWPWKEEPERWRPAPSLGQDNRYVLMDLLKHSEVEYDSFAAMGVL